MEKIIEVVKATIRAKVTSIKDWEHCYMLTVMIKEMSYETGYFPFIDKTRSGKFTKKTFFYKKTLQIEKIPEHDEICRKISKLTIGNIINFSIEKMGMCPERYIFKSFENENEKDCDHEDDFMYLVNKYGQYDDEK